MIVQWDADAAPVHRVGWVNYSDLMEAMAKGDALESFRFADTKRDADYSIKGLQAGQRYWIIVGAAQQRFGDVEWGGSTSLTVAGSPAFTHGQIIPEGKIIVHAPIDSVEIIAAESDPPQYLARIIAGLPNACAEFYGYGKSRSGNDITISVSNLKPAPAAQVACAQIYRTHELSIPLGTDFKRGEAYTVRVNNVSQTFTAQGVSGSAGAHGVVEPAPIESVAIQVGAGPRGDGYVVVEYALPNGCYKFHSSELTDRGGKFVVEILNYRRDRDDDGNPIACAAVYLTFDVRLLIATDIQVGQVYDVTVNGKTYAVAATAAK